MNLIFDWLGREGGSILSWWLLTVGAVVAVFPLFFRFARGLPSRGYALARAAGLLLTGYIFWILNILDLFRNDPGNAALSALILFGIGLLGYVTWRDREPIIPWLRAHWRLILSTEALFLVAFFGWALVRALNPNLTATEKPMEMAFLSASRRSATFPPNDPWMSGFAISYYHFGYILAATLANLSGVGNGIAFNLTAALLFGLTCVGAFGVGFDLVAARQNELPPEKRRGRWSPYAVGILATLMLGVMGNLGTAFVEVPYQYNLLPASYFHLMDIEERDGTATGSCPQATYQLPPNSCFWWWFRWSRVVRDRNLDGSPVGAQPIEEFPQFSFILSDIHPHVLALPFVLLALGLMLNLVLTGRGTHPWEFLIYVICIGGLVFLNSWDVIFLGVLVGAEGLRRLIRNGTGGLTREDWLSILGFGIGAAILTGILYLPFLISFRSQAGGFLPNVIWPTDFQQFFLIFGTFLVILCAFLVAEFWRARRTGNTFNAPLARQVILYGLAGLVMIVVVLAVVVWLQPDARAAAYQSVDASGGFLPVIVQVLVRRLAGIPTEGLLLVMVFVVIGRLFAREPRLADRTNSDAPRRVITYSPATGFALFAIGVGAILALAPDFAYLRDDFGVRINTIFKLYYQTWIVWSVVSAYALWSLLGDVQEMRLPLNVRRAVGAVATVFIAAGMIYAPLAIDSRAVVDGGHTGGNDTALTLDGANTLAVGQDDYNVISCLSNYVHGDQAVVAEGMVDPMAYQNQYGRVSGLTGIPTLMGWSNHESQWRGSTYPAARGTRIEDEAMLYNTTDWQQAQQIISKYHITYVYVGPTERTLYGSGGGLDKFSALTPVCQSGDVAVYATSAMPGQATVSTNNAAGG